MEDTARYEADGLEALPIGSAIGGYAIRRLIGHGGFGITYEAHNRVTGKEVAIKEFFPSSMVRRDGQSRLIYSKVNAETITWALRKFEETTTTLCGLSHPNIVQVHDYVPANDTGYMIMEFLEGQTLKDWLKAQPRPPSLDELRPVVDPVMEALVYVHGRGLIHRDIAPDNILITRQGRPVLIDFGSVSRDLSDARQQQMSGTVGLTKRYYTAPEQMRAKARPTPEADIYSMGAVLYRALSGSEPVDGQDRIDALFHGQTADPYEPLMKRLPSGCPPRAAKAIDTALAVRPEGRIHTMANLRGELGSASPPAVVAPPTLTPSPARPVGRWVIGTALAVALIGGGVLAGKLLSSSGPSDRAQTEQQARDQASQADTVRQQSDAEQQRRQQAEFADREARLHQQQADFEQQQQLLGRQQADLAERQRQQDADRRQQADDAERALAERQRQQAEDARAEQARQADQDRLEQERQEQERQQESQQPTQPSFSCAHARLSVEQAICGDSLLARLDSQMGALYQAKKARVSGAARTEFLSTTRKWLQNRNARCGALSGRDIKTCLLAAYAQEIEYLKY